MFRHIPIAGQEWSRKFENIRNAFATGMIAQKESDRISASIYFRFWLTIISENSFLSSDFLLHRSGTVKLTAVRVNRHSDFPDFGVDDNEIDHRIDNRVSQLYYFLRDICHRHQHHHRNTDTIIGLTRRSKTGDDIAWRLFTLQDLNRTAISYRHRRTVWDLDFARGLLAYSKTFVAICRDELPAGNSDRFPIPRYYHDNIMESINVVRDTAEYRSTQRHARWEFVRYWAIAILLAGISLIGLVRIQEFEGNEGLQALIDFVLHHGDAIGLAVLGIMISHAVSLFVHSSAGRRMTRKVHRISQVLNKYLVASIAIAISAFLFMLTYQCIGNLVIPLDF